MKTRVKEVVDGYSDALGTTSMPQRPSPLEHENPYRQAPRSTDISVTHADPFADLVPAGASALMPEGIEERHAGIAIPSELRAKANAVADQAFNSPFAPIRDAQPELFNALHSANAMTPANAGTFARQLGKRVVEGLTPAQTEQFGKRLTLDNLEAEAKRKSAGASATAEQAVNHRMEVRARAEGDLARAQIEAKQKVDAGIQQAQDAQAAGRPPETVRSLITSAQLDHDDIMRTTQHDHDVAVKAGDVRHDELQIEAFQKRQAAETAAAEAAKLRRQVPNGIERQPWFRRANARHQAFVQPFNEAGAIGSGVDPASFRNPSLGSYLRLTPQDRINEGLIRRTQDAAAQEPGSTTPRTGLALRVLGQKHSVIGLTPTDAGRPLQGPDNVRRSPSTVQSPTATTLQSGSTKEFRGAPNYSTDYLSNVERDAVDKVAKAQKNAVWDAVHNGAGRELAPDEMPRSGERMAAFNDRHEIVDPPQPNDANFQQVKRYAVSPDVSDAIRRWATPPQPTSKAGRAVRDVMGTATRSVLLNPAAAAGHSLTLASSVGSGVPAEGIAAKTVGSLPIGKIVTTAQRMAAVDFNAPSTVERLQRLALSGGLRITDERESGWLNKGHHVLFGPEGVDPRARLVASEDFEAAARKSGLTPTDPAFVGLERDYVNGHAGNYVGKNAGVAQQFLQESGIAPFIAINKAKLGTSFKGLFGTDGTPNPSIAHRAQVMARGPIGTAAALAGGGYLLSGHSAAENAPGHETDMATGVYETASGYHYYRGHPSDAVAYFGEGTKEVYLRKGSLDPTQAAAIRVLEPIAYAKPGDKVSELMRAAANTALGLVGPGPAAAMKLATGKSMYLDRDGNLGSVQGLHLAKDEGMTDRLVAAVHDVNTLGALGLPSPSGPDRTTASKIFGNLNPLTAARPDTRAGIERHNVMAWHDDVVRRIYSEQNLTKRFGIVEDALTEASKAGYVGPKIRADFMRAFNRASEAGENRSDSSMTRFLREFKGAVP